ncbi:uncharacterized protein LOC136094977 [Hydra vulgaris]|uniref:uncharacterized protein LOC136094977 n=1 Tax=Hydra vulgaris TaxID=6087 RepID=UPI0032EA89F6
MADTRDEIKKLFKEMFGKYKKEFEEILKQQEINIIAIVSSSVKIIHDRLDKVEKNVKDNAEQVKSITKEVEEMKESLNFHEQLIDNKIKTLREIEDRSRRNNLRIDGVKESENESWEESDSKVKKIFEDYLNVKNVKIERAHRTGKKDVKKPRTIVLKLLDFKDKTEILKKSFNLKGKNIFINEDFCPETTQIRRVLKEK